MSFNYNNYGAYTPYQYGQQNLYQPALQQPVMPPMAQQQPVQNTDDRMFVANEAAANAFRVAAGASVRLWDSSKQTFYEKSAGIDGREYPMLIYDYQLRQSQPTQDSGMDLSKYVTREEMEQRLAEMRPVPIKARPRKEVEENV